MAQISEVLDIAQLQHEIREGYVTERRHPEFGELAIYNYSPKCQYENRWNEVTRLTRGLIANLDSGDVVARGFPKFFNYGDDENTGPLDLDAPILGVWDKLDGSLGIHYPRPDGRFAIATRGSFVSEQALHATELIRGTELEYRGPVRATWLFEIIYPGNRIVLDYGARDELVYLGDVYLDDGSYMPPPDDLDGASERFGANTLREALAIPPRKNAEGLVVWFDEQRAVKLKQADYVELHRIVSNLSEKEVWRQLRGGTFHKFAENLPDEFHDWARDTAQPIAAEFVRIIARVDELYTRLLDLGLPDRKAQAQWIKDNAPVEYRGFIFGLLDGRSIADGVWKLVEPKEKSND